MQKLHAFTELAALRVALGDEDSFSSSAPALKKGGDNAGRSAVQREWPASNALRRSERLNAA